MKIKRERLIALLFDYSIHIFYFLHDFSNNRYLEFFFWFKIVVIIVYTAFRPRKRGLITYF